MDHGTDDGPASTATETVKPDVPAEATESFATPLASPEAEEKTLEQANGGVSSELYAQDGTAETLVTPKDSSETGSKMQQSESTSIEKEIDEDGLEHTENKEDDLELGLKPEDEQLAELRKKASAGDPNIVDFDGDNDQRKAVNWPASKKWGIVTTLSIMTFITPLASSMFAPGVPEVLQDFQVSGIVLSSFVVSVYILGYCVGPLVVAPLSELYGRSILYHSMNLLFIVWTIACALATDMNMLIAFRFFEGLCGSAVLTMGGGTLADLFVQEERGRAVAIWASGPMIGPVIGPVAGAFLSQAKGWRWTFWIIAIVGGVVGVLMLVVLDETYSPVILERETKKLRKETGNQELRSVMDSGLTPRAAFWRAIVRPTKMLFLSPIVFLLSLYNAVIYGYLYIVFTTITELFEGEYHFGSGVVGLTFLGIGVGMVTGLGIFGFYSDRLLKKKAAQGEKKPEYRLPPMGIAAFMVPIGLFIYGWTAEKHTFWFWPIFGTAFLGLGLIGAFMCIQTYLIDAFTTHAASAIAANTILRSLAGALLPLAGPPLYQNLGLGWGNSLLGFIAVAMIPIPYLFAKYGERIRKNPRFQPVL